MAKEKLYSGMSFKEIQDYATACSDPETHAFTTPLGSYLREIHVLIANLAAGCQEKGGQPEISQD